MILLIIMKVYCPSYKRPNAPLFSVAKNLIIVLQHEEEIEEYKKINEPRGHQVVCIDIDGNQRILEARNWIIQQDDDWSMQIDDDITEFCVWNKDSQSYDQTDWEHFIEESESILNDIDKTKTGMIRFGDILRQTELDPPKNDNTFEITKRDFAYFQCALFNNRLLKFKNFEYEGHYIFDDSLGKYKTYGDDYFIQYWCVDNDIDIVLMNYIAIKSIYNEWSSSTLFNKNYDIFEVMCQAFHWLLQRFKHNLALTNLITKRLIDFTGKSASLEMYTSLNKNPDSKLYEITQKLINFAEKPASLEIYVPSHRRPDSKLFEIASGLNIVLQHEEDVEPYSKWKNKHNVIYMPELKGLLDARNWILDNGKDWSLMIDDDLLEIRKSNNKHESKLVWSQFLAETKNILSQLDKQNIGVVGFYTSTNKKFFLHYKDEFTIDKYFSIYGAVILNTNLLKSKGFKYASYPYDGFDGQKAYAEDTDLLCFCHVNNIDTIKIYSLRLWFSPDEPTICWSSSKNREKMVILSLLWLLNKYKDYPEIFKNKSYVIAHFLVNLQFYSQEELLNELVKELSYEGLDISKEESIMRMKILCGGLVIFLMAAMNFTSCGNNDENIVTGGNSYNNKKVDERFWGEWQKSSTIYNDWWNIQINETEFKEEYATGWSTYPAWSEDNILFVRNVGQDFRFELDQEGYLVLLDFTSNMGSPFYYYSQGVYLIKKPE